MHFEGNMDSLKADIAKGSVSHVEHTSPQDYTQNVNAR